MTDEQREREPRDHYVEEGGDGTDLSLPEDAELPTEQVPDDESEELPDTEDDTERASERAAGLGRDEEGDEDE